MHCFHVLSLEGGRDALEKLRVASVLAAKQFYAIPIRWKATREPAISMDGDALSHWPRCRERNLRITPEDRAIRDVSPGHVSKREEEVESGPA